MASIQSKKYKTSKGRISRRWYTVLDQYDSKNKRKRKWLGGHATKREAERAMPELLAKFHGGSTIVNSNMTLGEWITFWLQKKNPDVDENISLRGTLKRSTHRSYTHALNKHVLPKLGNKHLAKLTSVDFDSIYLSMLRAGLTDRTVQQIHIICRSLLNGAVKKGVIQTNPVLKCENIPAKKSIRARQDREREQKQLWTAKELKAFLDGSKDHRFFSLFWLAACTGMRASELAGLRWRDVDFDQHVLSIKQTAVEGTGGVKIDTPKSKRSSRTIRLDDATVKVLHAHKLDQTEKLEVLGDDNSGDLVFLNENSQVLASRIINKEFKKQTENLSLPIIRFHDLRHLHLTMLVAVGTDIKTVSNRAGHHSVQFTLDVYVDPVAENEIEAVEKLSQKIFG